MNPPLKTLQAVRLLAALATFSAVGYAADSAKPQDIGPAPAAPTPVAVTPTPQAPLHEIGASAPAPAVPMAQPAPAALIAPSTQVAPKDSEAPEEEEHSEHHGNHTDKDDMVAVMGQVAVLAGERCEGNAVSVMGPLTVDGIVDQNAVSVMGSNTVNGTVHGDCVAVLGVMKLGPKAHIDGDLVCVGGLLDRAPGSFVGGKVVSQAGSLGIDENSGAYSWIRHGLRLGRPLAIGPHLFVFWVIVLCQVAFYLLLALVFPGGITKCADTLAHRPGITFLTGILAILGIPVLFILLLVTVVGIPVALVVLPLSVLAAVVFGKAAIYAFIGRSVARGPVQPVVAAAIGVAIMMLFYLIPFLGLAIWFVVAYLGFACAVTTLFTATRMGQKTPPAAAAPLPPVVAPVAPPAASLVVPAMPLGVADAPPESVSGQPQPPVAEAVPPIVPPVPPVAAAPAAPVQAPAAAAPATSAAETSLPKAGFWIRMVALLIDVVLVGIVTSRDHSHDVFLLAIAAYGVLLWKFKGATVGDIIFGIKVVRADGAPIDWVTAIVRALACFLSLFFIGLGFIWIAFDPEKQGWHDKIAGTMVVKLPKGTSLI
jgi:uncharacterized RDD family membrane protein YckC